MLVLRRKLKFQIKIADIRHIALALAGPLVKIASADSQLITSTYRNTTPITAFLYKLYSVLFFIFFACSGRKLPSSIPNFSFRHSQDLAFWYFLLNQTPLSWIFFCPEQNHTTKPNYMLSVCPHDYSGPNRTLFMLKQQHYTLVEAEDVKKDNRIPFKWIAEENSRSILFY